MGIVLSQNAETTSLTGQLTCLQTACRSVPTLQDQQSKICDYYHARIHYCCCSTPQPSSPCHNCQACNSDAATYRMCLWSTRVYLN